MGSLVLTISAVKLRQQAVDRGLSTGSDSSTRSGGIKWRLPLRSAHLAVSTISWSFCCILTDGYVPKWPQKSFLQVPRENEICSLYLSSIGWQAFISALRPLVPGLSSPTFSFVADCASFPFSSMTRFGALEP
eukprot:scaffold72911_cov49-Attheya_sp.AAC.2